MSTLFIASFYGPVNGTIGPFDSKVSGHLRQPTIDIKAQHGPIKTICTILKETATLFRNYIIVSKKYKTDKYNHRKTVASGDQEQEALSKPDQSRETKSSCLGFSFLSLTHQQSKQRERRELLTMASLAQQFTGLRCAPLSSSRLWKPFASPKQTNSHSNKTTIVSSVAISNAQNKERVKLKELFQDAYERCRTAPMEGVAFSIDDFHSALEKYDFDSEIGTKVLKSLSFLVFNYFDRGFTNVKILFFF